jgi:acyl-homoserine lactone synthase
MVIVLTGRDRRKNPDYFDQHFRLRHEVFVRRRGWALPCANGREIDQYDTDEAIYFFDLNQDNIVRGSIRIAPSETCSLLADYFPHLVETGDPLRAPDIYECTRYIVMPDRKSRDDNRAAKARVIGAMLEWCLRKKLAFLQTVIETKTLASYLELTPLTIPLGLSHPYGGGRRAPGGGECMAIRWPVSPQVLDDVRAYGAHEPRAEAFAGFDSIGRHTPSELLH